MACISPDGKPTESGRKLLLALREHRTPEDVANLTELPLFRIRSGLRDLLEAGYVKEEQGKYFLAGPGVEALRKAGVNV